MVMPTDRIQQMLARGQNPTDVGVGPQVQPGSGGIFSKIDQTLMRPGGSFLLNLLAQEGRQVLAPGQAAFIPGPLGSVARAAQATQQQGQQQEAFDLRRRMLESQIGLNQAQIAAASQPGAQDTGIGDIDPDKFTPESLERFRQTGNFGLLEPRESNKDVNSLVNELADDVRSESKDFIQQQASFQRIAATAQNPSPAGDLALIFNFMKVLDPGSTVREGEFANAQNSGSVPTRIVALYNNVREGTRLTAEQRLDFANQAQNIFNAAAKQQQERNQRFRTRGRNAGLIDPFIDPVLPPAQPQNIFDPIQPPDERGQTLDEELDTSAEPLRLRNPG